MLQLLLTAQMELSDQVHAAFLLRVSLAQTDREAVAQLSVGWTLALFLASLFALMFIVVTLVLLRGRQRRLRGSSEMVTTAPQDHQDPWQEAGKRLCDQLDDQISDAGEEPEGDSREGEGHRDG